MLNYWLQYIQIRWSGLFDREYYLTNYPDVRLADVDPLLHYLKYGWKEARNPSMDFDSLFYMETNPDVRQSGINPLVHFLRRGRSQGRKPRPTFSTVVCTPKVDTAELAACWQANSTMFKIWQADDEGFFVDRLMGYPEYSQVIIPALDCEASRPKVSFCVPVFYDLSQLRPAVQSFLAQTVADFELILLVGPSSADDSAFIGSFDDPRIRAVRIDADCGVAHAWNRGLELARGEYICLLGPDDVTLPENLATKIAVLNAHSSVGCVLSDLAASPAASVAKTTGEKGARLWSTADQSLSGGALFEKLLLALDEIGCQSVLARRACFEKLGGFDARLPFYADTEMWLRIALFYDVADLAQPLAGGKIFARPPASLTLPYAYLCKRLLLEKFPEQFGSAYHQAVSNDTSHRAFEYSAAFLRQGQFKLARLYLTFKDRLLSLASRAGHAPSYTLRLENILKNRKKTTPKISVIVTAYKHEQYIAQCLESILAQRGDFSVEIIVGDDDSPDRTRDIVATYAAQHPTVIFLYPLQPNVGITANIFRCLQVCDGDYIAFCEGDDYWLDPNKLQKQVTMLAEHLEYACCFNSILLKYVGDGRSIQHPDQAALDKPFLTTEDLIEKNYIGNFSCCMYRASVLRQLPDQMFEMFTVDWMVNMACGQLGKIGYLPEVLSVYRVHEQGAWSGKSQIGQLLNLIDYINDYNAALAYRYSDEFNHMKTIIQSKINHLGMYRPGT